MGRVINEDVGSNRLWGTEKVYLAMLNYWIFCGWTMSGIWCFGDMYPFDGNGYTKIRTVEDISVRVEYLVPS
jgi:hypothetical protein